MKHILIILLFISSVSQAQNFGAGRPAYLRGVVITSNFDSIYVRTAAGNGPLSVISKADFITGLGISVAAAGGEHEIQFNNSDVFTASDQFLYIASQNRLVVGGASSLNENLLLNKNLGSATADFIVMADNNSGGRMRVGDIGSTGFAPYIQMIPDGTDLNNSFGLFHANNSGSVAALVLRAQNLAGSGTLSTQPLFDLQNYTTSVMKIFANGTVGINQTSPSASAILDIASTTMGVLMPRMTYAQRDAISSPATGLLLYNTQTNKYHYYDGSIYRVLLDSARATTIIDESTYTPTGFGTTNVSGSTLFTTHYIIIGNTIHVWGDVSIDATTALTITEFGLSLPIASALASTADLSGTASYEDNTTVQIKADVTNSRAMFRFTPQTATNNKYSFHFTYKYFAP